MRPTGLVILDGWGIRQEKEDNAIQLAKTPTFDEIFKNHPSILLQTHGSAVGLPDGQMGNSEVGHLNIGAGRIVNQLISQINESSEKQFKDHQLINQVLQKNKAKNRPLHLIGLLSDGGVHSHQNHIFSILSLLNEYNYPKVYCHLISDGRDTAPKSILPSLSKLNARLKNYRNIQIASICGRFYAMDRDKRWERIQLYYDLIINQQAHFIAENAIEGIKKAYQDNQRDEFIKPIKIANWEAPKKDDLIIMMNIRNDRMRQITEALSQQTFTGFKQKTLFDNVCTLTKYHSSYNLPVFFPPADITNNLGEYIANLHLKQLRIAETEKYPHVTFFFNGGKDIQYNGENRVLLPSPRVKTYDLCPEMNCIELTKKLIQSMKLKRIDLFIVNFANADMVGHCGDLTSTIKAVESVDQQLKKILKVAYEKDWQLIITADHGNAELMFDRQTNQPHTAHTLSPVPFSILSSKASINLYNDGILADIAPTILNLMDLEKPTEMTGKSLIKQ